MNDNYLKELKTSLQEQGVKYCAPSYVDIHGVPKSKVVPISHFERMMSGSELCTGAALDGVPQDVSDEEVAAHPDPESAIILPWQSDIAWFASDLWCEGKPFEPCSRHIFKNILSRAENMGYKFNFGIEPEFFLLKQSENGAFEPIGPRDNIDKPCYDIRSTLDSFSLLEEIVATLNELGYDVYSYDHEDGNGQFEIDFMYRDGLTMADRFVFFRMAAGEIARALDMICSFMPKPMSNRTGNGMHMHLSMDDADGMSLFDSESDERGLGLSELAYHFLGGILRHAPALAALVAPSVNSYKRLVIGHALSGSTWAPAHIAYGDNNRTAMVRVPHGHLELRLSDSSCNPYLSTAAVLAAGIDGIDRKLDPGEPHNINLYDYTIDQLSDMKIGTLPQTLREALDALSDDSLFREELGDSIIREFISIKEMEWVEYQRHVSDWEIKRYLEYY